MQKVALFASLPFLGSLGSLENLRKKIAECKMHSAILVSLPNFAFYISYLSALISTPMSDLSQMTIGES